MGKYGKSKICAGIVGFADLTLGASVSEVLEAQVNAGGGRFKRCKIRCWVQRK